MTVTDAESTNDAPHLRTTSEWLRACYELNQELLWVTTLDEAAPLMVSHVARVFGCAGGALVLGSSPCLGGQLTEYHTPDSPWSKLPDPVRFALMEALLRDRQPVIILDASRVIAASFPEGPPLTSLIAMPVTIESECMGVLLGFDFTEPHDPSAYAERAAMVSTTVSRAIVHLQALEARDRQQRLMQATLENTHSGIVYLDRDFTILEFNAAFAACCHQPVEGLRGKHLFDCFPSDGYLPVFEAARETGEVGAFHEVAHVFPDQPEHGVTYWDARLTPVKDDAGRVEGFVLSLTDLTEHVRAKQQLREAQEAQAREARFLYTIIENTANPVAYLDRDLNLVRVNSAAAESVKLPREEIIGRNLLSLFPGSELGKVEHVRDTGEPVMCRETRSTLGADEQHPVRYWDWSLMPVKDDRGEVEGLVFSAVEVTEQVEARERMVTAERTRAEVAETLAEEINHRMKNNLFLLAGLLGMQKDRLPAASFAAETLQVATARLLTFATVHEQLYLRRKETLDILDAIKQIADVDRESLARGHVRMSVTGTPVEYGSRAGSAICVIANELITNAIKYGSAGPEGELAVEVEVRQEGDELRLSVWNSGNPVPPGFDTGTEGTSGLSIVETVAMEQYGGRLSIRGERGGTMAEVALNDSSLREQG